MSEEKENGQINHLSSIPTVKIHDENDFSLSDEDLTDLRVLEDEAARTIQNYYRSKNGLESVNNLKDNSDSQYSDEEYIAALTIQNYYRSYCELKQTKVRQEGAAKIIQHHYRNYLRRSEEEFEEALEDAAKRAHQNYNDNINVVCGNNDDDQCDETVPNKSYIRTDLDKAACVIQKHYRTHLQERQEKHRVIVEDKAARTLQRHYKIHLNKTTYAKPTQFEVDELYCDKETVAAVKIQREYRNYLNRHKAAVKIQRHYRAHLDHLKRNDAASTIQHHYRLHLNRRDVYHNENCSVELLEENTEKPGPALSEDVAVSVIQKRYKQHYQTRQEAAMYIQGHYRNHLNHKKQKDEAAYRNFKQDIREKEEAAIKIQGHYKNHLNRKKQKDEAAYKKFKQDKREKEEAAIKIQGHYRKFKREKDERELKKLETKTEVEAVTFTQKQYGAHMTVTHQVQNGHERGVNDPAMNRQQGLNNKHSHIKPIPKRSISYSLPKSKIVECSPLESNKLFEQEWPDSKKNQIRKSVCSKKKIVQTSLDIKREKRRNEKNKNKDKFHLSGIKQNETNKTKSKDKASIEQKKPVTNNANYQKRRTFKKNTTPIEAGSGSSSIDTDPELTELRESPEEEKPDNSPDIDILNVANNDENATEEGTDGQDTTDLDKMDTPNINNSNLLTYTNNIAYQPPHNDFYRDPYRRSSESSISFTAPSPKLSPKKQISLGTLDSYAVQHMLKRNELLTRQKNDNHSYLHAYLKQMKLLKRSPPQNPRQKGMKHYSYSGHRRKSAQRESQDIFKGNKLEKIAGYGRNCLPDHDHSWNPIPRPLGSGLDPTVDHGASLGSHYPVLPSYGKMKTIIKEKSDPTEIPWPRDIG